MGFDATCAISSLPIRWGQPVVMLWLFQADIPREKNALLALPLVVRGRAGEWNDLDSAKPAELKRALPLFRALPVIRPMRNSYGVVTDCVRATDVEDVDEISEQDWTYATNSVQGVYVTGDDGQRSYKTWTEFKPHRLIPVLIHQHVFDALTADKTLLKLVKPDLVKGGSYENLARMRAGLVADEKLPEGELRAYRMQTRRLMFNLYDSPFGTLYGWSSFLQDWVWNLMHAGLTDDQLRDMAEDADRVTILGLALGWTNRAWVEPPRGPQCGQLAAHASMLRVFDEQLRKLVPYESAERH